MSLKPSHDPSCVLAYPFEENSDTTVYDQSASGFNGTIYGATRVQGKIARGFYFDGVDDYVQSSSFALTGTAISIVAWVNFQKQTYYQTIINKEIQSASQGFIYIFRLANTDTIAFQYATGTFYQTRTSGGFFTGFDNQYMFVAVTCDYENKILKFYRNGRLYEPCNITESIIFPSTNSACYIGSYQGTMHFFNGIIDEVRLYTRLLSDREILEHYRYGISQRARPRIPMFVRTQRKQSRQVA